MTFTLGRALFVFQYWSNLETFTFNEIIESFYAGFRLDLSAISYLVLVLFLFILASYFLFERVASKFLKYVVLTWVFITSLLYTAILGGESGLYAEWNTKLNFKAIHHLIEPSEVLNTASGKDSIIFLGYLILGIVLFFIYKKFFFHNPINTNTLNVKSRIVGVLTTLAMIVMAVIMMRGGFQQIPIITSDAYYTNEDILNDIAVNPLWNLGQSIEQNRRSMDGNPYEFTSTVLANQTVESLYQYPDTSHQSILNIERPNIVFILLEGWSADVVDKIGNYSDLTPSFNNMVNEGIIFTNFYSNGWTSDQGMCAILSGAPVFPHTSVVNQADKSRNVPSIISSLKDEGYQSLFYFGGQLSYGNIKSYLLNQNIDVVKEEKDFPNATHRGKLGIHDDFMFEKYLEGINELQEPFVTAFFTMSTHAPYDINDKKPLDYGGIHKEYLQSVMFSDSCIGDFMAKAQETDWYKNTLFVYVADHGHNTPIKKVKENFYTRNEIPFLLYGDVIIDSLAGTINTKIGSHLDISKTLLTQFNLPTNEYLWSKNLFDNEVSEFFPYVFHYGLGMKTPKGDYRYNLTTQKEYFYTNDSLELKNQCRSYFQGAYEDFMGL